MRSLTTSAAVAALTLLPACLDDPAPPVEAAARSLESPDDGGDDVWWGDASIRTAADLAQLRDVRVIGGNLTIEDSELGQIELPALEVVAGDLSISGSNALRRFSVPRLSVDGDLHVDGNDVIRTVELARVGDELWITRNQRLERVSIAETGVRIRSVAVYGNPSLVVFDALQQTEEIAGGFRLSQNPLLEHVIAPQLVSVGHDLALEGLPALDILGMPRLEYVRRELTVQGVGLTTWNGLDALRRTHLVVISHNPRLADIGLPGLDTVNYIMIFENPALGLIGLDTLTRAAAISVHDNATMPTCKIVRLMDRIETEFPTQPRGNDDDARCD